MTVGRQVYESIVQKHMLSEMARFFESLLTLEPGDMGTEESLGMLREKLFKITHEDLAAVKNMVMTFVRNIPDTQIVSMALCPADSVAIQVEVDAILYALNDLATLRLEQA